MCIRRFLFRCVSAPCWNPACRRECDPATCTMFPAAFRPLITRPLLSLPQDCSSSEEYTVAAALLPLSTAFYRVRTWRMSRAVPHSSFQWKMKVFHQCWNISSERDLWHEAVRCRSSSGFISFDRLRLSLFVVFESWPSLTVCWSLNMYVLNMFEVCKLLPAQWILTAYLLLWGQSQLSTWAFRRVPVQCAKGLTWNRFYCHMTQHPDATAWIIPVCWHGCPTLHSNTMEHCSLFLVFDG